jgi:hypothetical protein
MARAVPGCVGNTETERAQLSGFPALQIRQNFHVPIETGRTACEVFADVIIPFWNGMFCHTLEVGMERTIDAAWVGKGFGEIGLREAKEFFFVKFLSSVSWHRLALPASVVHSGQSCMAMISSRL